MLTRLLEHVYDWLSPADDPCPGDVIFVLAGRPSRKLYGLELYRQGLAGRLLLSVGRFEIRKLAQAPWLAEIDLLGMAAATPPAQRHYFVSVEGGATGAEPISVGRFGTLSEIRALAKWLSARPHLGSLVVVSSGPHLRRVRACCRRLLPTRLRLCFVATPRDGWLERGQWWRNRRSRRVVLKELGKLPIYRLILMGAGRRAH